MSDAAPADFPRLLTEIEDEVRRRRASGDYPADFERELDELFDRFAPPAVSDSFEAALSRAEARSVVGADAPVDSARPGAPQAKRIVRKAIAWYVHYIVQQINEFATSLTRAVRLLGERVSRIEAAVPGADPRVAAETVAPRSAIDGAVVAAVLGEPRGRVAIAESGDGTLLDVLAAAGLDVYGVEARLTDVDAANARGLEVRADEPLQHLRALADGVLGGLVLAGCVERLPLGDLVELADLATAKLGAGGRVVVAGATPEAWGRDRSALAADLAPGRPLHAATWRHLLAARGFVDVEEQMGPADDNLAPVDGAAADENFRRIATVLFPPAWYVVAGSRPADS